MKRQIRVVWNIFAAGLLVIVTMWVVNSLLPEKRPYIDPDLALYANGLVTEDGTLQLFVEKSDKNHDEEKHSKSNNQELDNRRNRYSAQKKKEPTKEDIEAFRKSLQNRKDLKKNRNNRVDISSLDDDAIDRFIANGEREEDLRRLHPKIRKAFLRKVIQRKGILT